MPDRRALLVAASAFAVISSTACAESVRGSGVRKTERRVLAPYARIDVRGAFEVEIRQSPTEGAEVTADDNLLAWIETRVEGSSDAATLVIEPRHDVSLSSRDPIVVRVDVKTLSAIALDGSSQVRLKALRSPRLAVSVGGSGDVDLAAIDAGDLRVTIGGSGRFSAAGRSARLEVAIGGSGDCRARDLVADDVAVHIGGSGDADVQAQKTLRIAIGGSGRVRYAGSAMPVTAIAGSGTVERL